MQWNLYGCFLKVCMCLFYYLIFYSLCRVVKSKYVYSKLSSCNFTVKFYFGKKINCCVKTRYSCTETDQLI